MGVSYINVNTKSCYQFIKTMTNLRKKLDVLVVHFHNKVCTWHMLSTHTGMMHQLFYYTVQTEAYDTYNILFMLKLGWWWPITLEYFVIVSKKWNAISPFKNPWQTISWMLWKSFILLTYRLIKNFCNYLSYTCLRLQTKRLWFWRISHRPLNLSRIFPYFLWTLETNWDL